MDFDFDRNPVSWERHSASAPEPATPEPVAAALRGTTSFDRCFFAAQAWTLLTTVVLFALVGPPPTSSGALAMVVGVAVVPSSISAGATWLVLRRRRASLGLVLLVCLPSFVAVAVVNLVVALHR